MPLPERWAWSPLHAGHLESMLAVTELGAVVAPPVPAFYTKPASVDDIVEHTVGRVLDLFDLETSIPRWGEDIGPDSASRRTASAPSDSGDGAQRVTSP